MNPAGTPSARTVVRSSARGEPRDATAGTLNPARVVVRTMSNVVFVAGERITLRPVEEDDLEFVTEGVNHPQVRPFVGQSFPTTLAGERRYFEELNERRDAIQLLVVAEDERIGVVEFDPIDRETGVTELGFWIHPDHHGEGYGREALCLVLAYAFAELRIHKVTANAYDVNEASRGLLESVGFTHEEVGREDAFLDGDYHDTHYYGLLEREWRDRSGGKGD